MWALRTFDVPSRVVLLIPLLRPLPDITLVPSRQWSSPSSSSDQTRLGPSLLGLSLKLCDPSEALSQVWHILEVLEGSPAEVSLLGYSCYGGHTNHLVETLSIISERR
jgi:hypothetical protein